MKQTQVDMYNVSDRLTLKWLPYYTGNIYIYIYDSLLPSFKEFISVFPI